MERIGQSTTRAAPVNQHRTAERDKLIADAMGKLAKAELRQRRRSSARNGHGNPSGRSDANGGEW
jgi:hypothetical protein